MGEVMIGFKSTKKMRNELKALCAALDVSIQEFLNKVVREAIEKYKK